MRKPVVLFVVLAMAAGAGSRSGDDDSAGPDGGDDSEVTAEDTTDVGVTDDSITIGVVADLTGVVPGLFKAAPDAVKAFAAMVNEDGGINGREVIVKEYDTGTNDNGNRLAYEKASATRCSPRWVQSRPSTPVATRRSRSAGSRTWPGSPPTTPSTSCRSSSPAPACCLRQRGASRYLAEQFPEAVKQTAIFTATEPGHQAHAAKELNWR